MKTLTLTYNNDYQPILHHHTPPPLGHLLFQRQRAAPQYNLSKLSSTFGLHHWSILEEQPDIQLFIFIELTLFNQHQEN